MVRWLHRNRRSVIKEGALGFTLIETLVAVAIITMVIIGPLTLAQQSISAAINSKNQITASYLAQEAIEFIVNIRDNNALQPITWLNGLGPCITSNGCYIDVMHHNITSCSGACPIIKYDPGESYYNYSSGNQTIFTRTVKVTTPIGGNTDEARIESTVSWNEKSGPRSFTLQQEILNWK